MKISTPPRIIWNIQGSVSNSEQKRLIHEAHRQSNLLTQSMAFQGLSQGRHGVIRGNYSFRCVSVFGLQSVTIGMIGGDKKRVPQILDSCFCTFQVVEGIILRCIPANTQSENSQLCIPLYTEGYNKRYPEYITYPPYDFGGPRYEVLICRTNRAVKKVIMKPYICIPTDHETYEEEDTVAVLYIDAFGPSIWQDPEANTWELDTEGTPSACGADLKYAENVCPTWPIVDPLMGQFVILPYLLSAYDGLVE